MRKKGFSWALSQLESFTLADEAIFVRVSALKQWPHWKHAAVKRPAIAFGSFCTCCHQTYNIELSYEFIWQNKTQMNNAKLRIKEHHRITTSHCFWMVMVDPVSTRLIWAKLTTLLILTNDYSSSTIALCCILQRSHMVQPMSFTKHELLTVQQNPTGVTVVSPSSSIWISYVPIRDAYFRFSRLEGAHRSTVKVRRSEGVPAGVERKPGIGETLRLLLRLRLSSQQAGGAKWANSNWIVF